MAVPDQTLQNVFISSSTVIFTKWKGFLVPRSLLNMRWLQTRYSASVYRNHYHYSYTSPLLKCVPQNTFVTFRFQYSTVLFNDNSTCYTFINRPESGALVLIMLWMALNWGCSLSATSCRSTDSLVVMMTPSWAILWERETRSEKSGSE